MIRRARHLLPLSLLLSGCSAIGNMADSLGSHMPVVGERCEHWQCFTSSGQAQSQAIAAYKQKEQEATEQEGEDKKGHVQPEQPPAPTVQGYDPYAATQQPTHYDTPPAQPY